MAKSIDYYLSLITAEHRDKPKFTAMVAGAVAPFVRIQEVLDSMIPLFDLDTPPVGQQLDVIGKWVNAPRDVQIPIEGVLFEWDGDASVGWDLGIWQDPNIPAVTITVLPDDAYLTLIRAKIAANRWMGTTEAAYDIYEFVFPGVTILIQDHQNMSFSIIIFGVILDSLTKALLVGGYLPLKPEGVRIAGYFFPFSTDEIFGWDIEDSQFQGWDVGEWAYEMEPA